MRDQPADSASESTPQTPTVLGEVDLTNCDREPIHIPGAVQQHGVLFAAALPSLHITHISENAATLLGINPAAQIGRPLQEVLPTLGGITEEVPVLLDEIRAPNNSVWEVLAHRRRGDHEDQVIVELEPKMRPEAVEAGIFRRFVGAGMARLRAAQSVTELAQDAVAEVRELTGFDRVMAYRFHPDAHGEVIAEARAADWDSFDGLHFPASDIPRQARALYLRNGLRLIADVGYAPAALIATPDLPPLDLTFSVLRSVSPIHIQYLKNMGVGASMSISLIQDGKLWGLIACHHRTAWYVPYAARAACELLGQVMSAQIAAAEAREGTAAREQSTAAFERIRALVEESEAIVPLGVTLEQAAEDLQTFAGASGVAYCENDSVCSWGETPTEETVLALTDWLRNAPEIDLPRRRRVWITDAFSKACPLTGESLAALGGLMAISIAPETRAFVLWFRPEVVRTVEWAGDPNKPVEGMGPDARLTPRASFASWQETVRGRSAPWEDAVTYTADRLRHLLVAETLRRSQAEIVRLNAALTRSNAEHEAFTYAAAHDLKEPLRGIRHLAVFIAEDEGKKMSAESRGYLDTINSLSRRMDSMIESLFEYARIAGLELNRQRVDLNVLVREAREMLAHRFQETGTELRVPRLLPTVVCDRVQVAGVFYNLIANALKYNDRPPGERWIEVGYQEATAVNEPPVFYVQDNGIGIAPEQHENIFRIFRRLHEREAYGGGIGAGLTIVQRVIARHGGQLWLESDEGQETAFYFTLSEGRERV